MLETVAGNSIRIARPDDADAIKRLIDVAVAEGQVLPRLLPEIETNHRQFLIWLDASTVAGCCAIHPDTATLAEIRSIVVRPDLRGKGHGHRLGLEALSFAASLGMERVYTLTRARRFFNGLGFVQIDMGELPQKVFKDCLRCSLYPHCDEIAMIRNVTPDDFASTWPTGG